jgi:hypothetical protein
MQVQLVGSKLLYTIEILCTIWVRQLLKFIKLTRKQTVEFSWQQSIKVLEATLSIPSHEAQKWREGVVGKSCVSPYYGCGRASSVGASKSLDMEYTFFYIENGRSMLLRKVCTYVPNYVTIHPRRINVTLRFPFFCIYFCLFVCLFYLTTPSTAVVI